MSRYNKTRKEKKERKETEIKESKVCKLFALIYVIEKMGPQLCFVFEIFINFLSSDILLKIHNTSQINESKAQKKSNRAYFFFGFVSGRFVYHLFF